MTTQITLNAQIRCLNGNFMFPGAQGYFGVSQLQLIQANPGGGQPGMIQAIATGQGTLIDLSTFSPAMTPGGWCIFVNNDPAITVTWGPDNGSGLLEPSGDLGPGEPALFRCAAGGLGKYRFKSASGTPAIQVFFLVP